MGMIGVKLDLFLAFNEPLSDMRGIPCFLCSKDKTASFVITLDHDTEFWALKMLILLKFHLFISSLLDFIFCVMFASRSNLENHSCNFLKFSQSTTNMMRICLLWASAYRILLQKLVIHVKFWGFRYAMAYWQIGINSHNFWEWFCCYHLEMGLKGRSLDIKKSF